MTSGQAVGDDHEAVLGLPFQILAVNDHFVFNAGGDDIAF